MASHKFLRLFSLVALTEYALAQGSDPCAALVGQQWVAPRDVRACFQSFKDSDNQVKTNVLNLVEKSLAFHTSTNYQIHVPPPYDKDVQEDILADLDRIRKQSYESEFDFHLDIQASLRRLKDGHCTWRYTCFYNPVEAKLTGLADQWFSFVPTPLVVLSSQDGDQNIHIAPEAFSFASAEFPDQIQFWQDSLPGDLKGKLESLNAAKVVSIDGKDPWVAVNEIGEATGVWPNLGTRQNSVFAGYRQVSVGAGFDYVPGDFAQLSLPTRDSVDLEVILANESVARKITILYRSRVSGAELFTWTDGPSYHNNVCIIPSELARTSTEQDLIQQSPHISSGLKKLIAGGGKDKFLINALESIDMNLAFPPELFSLPAQPGGGIGRQAFYDLDDETGVFSLGSFSGGLEDALMQSALTGLTEMKARGKTRLIVDVTNNGGGSICLAHFLHRVIVGPKASTVPQAGLDTKLRNTAFAREIVDEIIKQNLTEDDSTLYSPKRWRDENNTPFPVDKNYLVPPVNVTINGREDQFSHRIGQECQPFTISPPDAPLFNASNVAIVSNSACASACSLFSITMKKLEGVKTVVVGGKKDIKQDYCGTVGGNSLFHYFLVQVIYRLGLQDRPEAITEAFLIRGLMGINWRLAYSLDHPEEPEEWQDHETDIRIPTTRELVNNPLAIWKEVAKRVFK